MDKHEAYGMAKHAMAGHDKESKPKKEIKSIHTRRATNGGYIHEHHHTHPDAHPMEEHMSADQDSMVGHMLDHMGDANPGEAEAGGAQAAAAPSGAALGGAMPTAAV